MAYPTARCAVKGFTPLTRAAAVATSEKTTARQDQAPAVPRQHQLNRERGQPTLRQKSRHRHRPAAKS
jgi:hypothetical protein